MASTLCFTVVIALCLSCLTETYGEGFYAHNSVLQKSVLYKPLRNKQELESEILHLFGLENIPRPKNNDTHSSAREYIVDLYKSMEKERGNAPKKANIGKTLRESDFIVSFVNRIHHKVRHESNKRFWFHLSEFHSSSSDEVISAEFRIYHEYTRDTNTTFVLTLYAVAESSDTLMENVLEPVDETLMRASTKQDWLVFNVTGPVIDWIRYPERNHGLYLKIRSLSSPSKTFDPHEVGIIGPKGAEEKQPFIVAYFKTSQLHVRKTRAAKKKEPEKSYYDAHAWNPYLNIQDTYQSRRSSCQRSTLYISFKELGWENWIIAPDGYSAFYCDGDCNFPLSGYMNASNHAIVQTLVHLMDPSVVPKPCCVPTQLSAITVLYFDDNSNVILKKYKNMVIKSCGCH